MNNKNPLSAYVAAGHIAFVVATPLLLFIWGGSWLVERFSLPDWLKIIFIILGILVMACSLISYLLKLIAEYAITDEAHKSKHVLKASRKDNDFYYD